MSCDSLERGAGEKGYEVISPRRKRRLNAVISAGVLGREPIGGCDAIDFCQDGGKDEGRALTIRPKPPHRSWLPNAGLLTSPKRPFGNSSQVAA